LRTVFATSIPSEQRIVRKVRGELTARESMSRLSNATARLIDIGNDGPRKTLYLDLPRTPRVTSEGAPQIGFESSM
jgi:hypothetical protein